MAAGAVVLLAWPLSNAVKDARGFTLPDTRTLAKQWVDANVPPGSKVLIEGGKIAASRLSVPLADSKESLDRRISYWEVQEPRQARYLKILRRVHPGGGYQLEFMQIGSIAPWAQYRAQGVEYMVVRPDYLAGARKAKGDGSRLLEDLHKDPNVSLIKKFVGESDDKPGPTIEIYRARTPGLTGPELP
jgi:hypothetical protein